MRSATPSSWCRVTGWPIWQSRAAAALCAFVALASSAKERSQRKKVDRAGRTERPDNGLPCLQGTTGNRVARSDTSSAPPRDKTRADRVMPQQDASIWPREGMPALLAEGARNDIIEAHLLQRRFPPKPLSEIRSGRKARPQRCPGSRPIIDRGIGRQSGGDLPDMRGCGGEPRGHQQSAAESRAGEKLRSGDQDHAILRQQLPGPIPGKAQLAGIHDDLNLIRPTSLDRGDTGIAGRAPAEFGCVHDLQKDSLLRPRRRSRRPPSRPRPFPSVVREVTFSAGRTGMAMLHTPSAKPAIGKPFSTSCLPAVT